MLFKQEGHQANKTHEKRNTDTAEVPKTFPSQGAAQRPYLGAETGHTSRKGVPFDYGY
jgi:hypothetical protein